MIFLGCPRNVFGRNNYFYILSDNQTSANNAQSICISSNGTLAEIRNNDIQRDFIGYAVGRHIRSSLLQAFLSLLKIEILYCIIKVVIKIEIFHFTVFC